MGKSFPYTEEAKADLWTVLWEDDKGTYPIGYMLDRVFRELIKVPHFIIGDVDFNADDRTVKLLRGVDTEPERTAKLAQLWDHLRKNDTFKLLRGWRNELWPVYGRDGSLLFSMERVAISIIGAMQYGVHMTAYVRDETAPFGIKVWVPRRAANKSTFPGMLDNTVAGGLSTGEMPLDCIVREAEEEASLPADLVRSGAKLVNVVTYTYVTTEEYMGDGGFVHPECQWLYDLELPEGIVPHPNDGEVQEFKLYDVDQVAAQLANGEYKHDCGLIIIDFFIRHGILTEANEPDLKEIQRRIHREMPFPGPRWDKYLIKV
ncbi:NUDIX domain [Geosmithia morbida]|uniref:NUDIX domain n=1 Tax=Geosmithia morbida TaxID=1094350 RepID=A0A9P4Z0U4_9HYPO|nr:NUDIX domain [Geosmithia morbida]KAF4125347.1 NUDIX domain [Geosmithia morbida]